MILKNKLFTRMPPSREAISIYIFCEGVKREVEYFTYFKELDSRINIEVYPLASHEDNSPLGLFKITEKCLVRTENNPNPKYEFLVNDKVWIVLDTDQDKSDSRKPQILAIRNECKSHNWNIAESNPCFEGWLFNHLCDRAPELENKPKCESWKRLLSNQHAGGFDSRKHPIYIKDAIENSKKGFLETNEIPDVGFTQVFRLGEIIYQLTKEKVESVRREHNI